MLIGMPLLRVFDRMSCGGIILSTSGRVLTINTKAQQILQEMFCLSSSELEALYAPEDQDNSGREVIKRLLSRGRTRIRLDSENWILIEREGQRPLIMNAIPVPALSEDGPHTVLLLIDLAATPLPQPAVLEQIFRLTPAEARLALLLAGGATTAEAAAALGVSVATTRTQLAAIFAKTHTRRQAELVMLISRLSALP